MYPRITLIGAGSVEFTRILLADLSTFPELAESTIVLHDIDSERLDTAAQIAPPPTGQRARGSPSRPISIAERLLTAPTS